LGKCESLLIPLLGLKKTVCAL